MAKNMDYDVAIIGGGPGGYVSAIRASHRGLKAALIEKDKIGGVCLNKGCIPTKALLNDVVRFQSLINVASVCELDVSKIKLNINRVMERKKQVVKKIVTGVQSLLIHHGISVFHGHASLVNPERVLIKNDEGSCEELKCKKIIIAVGVIPDPTLPIQIDKDHILSTDEALELDRVPGSLLIIGGGKRGVEFANIFASFGSEVSLVECEDRILPKMDGEISIRYRRFLTKRKIKIFTGLQVKDIDVNNQEIQATLVGPKGNDRITVEKILFAGRRRPKVEDLGLSNIHLSLKGGFISVNPHMETAVPGIYAVGDALGKGYYAHKAYAEAATAINHIAGDMTTVNYRLIPSVVYTYPEVASIGLTEAEAAKEGEISVGKFPFMGCGKSVASGEEEGIVKVIMGKKYGEVLGVHIIGPCASELIALASLAMKNELGIEEIKAVVFAHPTYSEAFWEASLDAMGEAINVMKE